MKTIIKAFLCVCIPLIFAACEDNSVSVPKATMTINQMQFSINESMIINFKGTADQVVVFTGDDMHNYELRDKSNTGFVVNKGLFTYSYSTPGTYKVVCVAVTYDDLAVGLKRDTSSYTIKVIDDETEIDKLSCPQILYDEVFANKLTNDEWLMILPRKVKYSTSTPSISLTQRLQFYTRSTSTKVSINNLDFVSTTKYNLASPLDIVVTSNFGTTRPYKLYTMYYPEFVSFKLSNVEGTLVRNEYDYSSFKMQLTLPAGTNVSNMIPQFTTTSATDKVYIVDVEQTSGTSSVNFTQDVTYKLVSIFSATNPNMQAITMVNVKIIFQ